MIIKRVYPSKQLFGHRRGLSTNFMTFKVEVHQNPHILEIANDRCRRALRQKVIYRMCNPIRLNFLSKLKYKFVFLSVSSVSHLHLCPSANEVVRKGNIFSRVCLSVIVFMIGGGIHLWLTSIHDAFGQSQVTWVPPRHGFKLVHLGSPRTCASFFSMCTSVHKQAGGCAFD